MSWDSQRLSAVLAGAGEGEARQADRFALWALWAVESFGYLPPLDHSNPLTARGTQVVELARVRWATGTAVTSVDLCAAMLGVQHAGFPSDGHAADVGSFKGKSAAARHHRDALPPKARLWIDSVWRDDEFRRVRVQARNPFTHSTMPRDVRIEIGGTSSAALQPREFFPVGPNGDKISSNEVVTLARRVAERWVSKFFDGLGANDFGLTKTDAPPIRHPA